MTGEHRPAAGEREPLPPGGTVERSEATHTPPRTVVEFVDRPFTHGSTVHKTAEIRVNGSPVLVDADGARIELREPSPGGEPLTVVHLRLLPTEVHFIHPEE